MLLVLIRTEVGKPNSTFWAELKCYLFPSVHVFKWRAFEVWRKPIFTLYYREYTHCLKRYFMLHFACETSRLSVRQTSASILGFHLPWYCSSLLEIFWWNCSLCYSPTALIFSGQKSQWESKKCTFKLCRVVQDQPPYHDIFLPYNYPQTW